MALKKILIMCSSDFLSEPRVLRTINSVASNYKVYVFSGGTRTLDNITHTHMPSFMEEPKLPTFHFKWPAVFRKLISLFIQVFIEKRFNDNLFFKRKYWTIEKKKLLRDIKEINPDVIIGHGINTLPLLAESEPHIKKIFNAHEYYLKEFENNPKWLKYSKPYYEFLMSSSINKIDLMFCVTENIQKEYQKNYKIKSVVITNATNYCELSAVKTAYPVKIIHHGAAMASRQIELMAEMMNFLGDKYELYFMLTPVDLYYLNELKAKYKGHPRIKFIDPVPVGEIAFVCNKFDIGLFILPPINFNWLNALPNKLFEFVQARLCIAVSPNPDMKTMVEKNNLGIVSEDYSSKSMADKILALSIEDIDNYKSNSHKHAKELSGEHNQKIMLEEIEKLVRN